MPYRTSPSVCLVYSSLASRVHVIEFNIVALFIFRDIVSGRDTKIGD